ncbi:MAG: AAA family ATPase [Nitrososphaeraceae archaeon]
MVKTKMSIHPTSYLNVIESNKKRQQSILDNIRNNFNANIIGYPEIKEFILLAIKAKMRSEKNKTHILLSGAPSTSKTVFLDNLSISMVESCFYRNGASLSKSGLLDALSTLDIKQIKYILIDEIDKMEKDQQTILLRALESGLLQETKFKRDRTLVVSHILFFGTSNDIDKIIDPLKTRFRCINMPAYDITTLKNISQQLIKSKYNFSLGIANKIINECVDNIDNCTIRDIVAISSMIEDPDKDLKTLIAVYDKYSFNDIEK